MKRILIVGATSAIAEATARLWAKQGHRLYLIGRNEERLRAIAADLRIRGAESTFAAPLDVNDFARHPAAIDDAIAALGGLDVALIAHGSLGDQKACERDFALALQEINTNAISVISLLTHLANRLEAQGHGTLAAISSVAGDRGRQSNYVYAAAKGAVTIFLQGLRNRLFRSGVHVLTIKPGFVDTPMTAALPKGGPLWAKPEAIAVAIDRGVRRRADEIYAPAFWRLIMAVIKGLPSAVIKRMSL
jgi:decaprenylphospho-beta-D-erythro-pentofuranosid-2-ulose 2-reductase